VEWSKIVESVAGSSPLAGALALALFSLWKKAEKSDSAKDARISQLEQQLAASQTARLDDLKSILKHVD
jgi:hypothetical protein